MKYSQMLKINSKFHWFVQKKIGIWLINKKNILAKFRTNRKFQQSTFFLLNTITYDFFRVGLTFQKAKRRMEDQLNKIGFGKSKKKESLEDAPGSCKSIDKLRTILFFFQQRNLKEYWNW